MSAVDEREGALLERLDVPALDIALCQYLPDGQGWGHGEGALITSLVQSALEGHPALIIRVSLRGIERIDVSCARQLVRLVRAERKRRGFCLVGASRGDVLMNWEAASMLEEQPLIAWEGHMIYHLLGPQPRPGLRDMFSYVLSVPVARTTEAARKLGLQVPNASNKLSQLWQDGYILRSAHAAQSGGVEYMYRRIG